MQNFKIRLTVHQSSSEQSAAPLASQADLLTQSSIILTQQQNPNQSLDPSSSTEISIHAKNTVTLEEYACRCAF